MNINEELDKIIDKHKYDLRNNLRMLDDVCLDCLDFISLQDCEVCSITKLKLINNRKLSNRFKNDIKETKSK